MSNLEPEVILQVVNKLIGEIEPVADSSIDNERYENLKLFIKLFDNMYSIIDDIAHKYKDSPFYSAKELGTFAQEYLDDIKNK